MVLKNSNLMYLVDFNGTIIEDFSRLGFITRIRKSMSSGLLMNPDNFDIRWSILTGQTKTEIPWISLVCHRFHLNPSQLITLPFWRKPKGFDATQYIINVLKDIVDGKFKVYYTKDKVEKIIYISNNLELTRMINSQIDRNAYQIIGVSSSDFYLGTFNGII